MENIVVCRNESDDDLNSIQSSESVNRWFTVESTLIVNFKL